MGLLDGGEVPITCPNCHEETQKTVAWLKEHDLFLCPACGVASPLETDQLRGEIVKAENSLDKFRRDVSQTIDIKFKL